MSFPEEDSYTQPLIPQAAYSIHYNTIGWRIGAIASIELNGITYQAYPFYDSNNYVSIAVREYGGSWTEYHTSIVVSPGGDGHNFISLGLDANGYIHIAYDMHDIPLRYRKSIYSIATFEGSLTGTLSMLGTNESAVAYPSFFNDPAGNLYFMFRDTTVPGGDLFFYKYNHSTQAWAAATGTDTGGKLINGKVSDQHPYWTQPVFDSNFGSGGYMHLFWAWYKSTDDTYANWAYVRWNGTIFSQTGGSQTIPITSSNEELVDDLADTLDQPTVVNMATYSNSTGNPHLVYAKNTGTYDRLIHIWHNGSSWVELEITTTNASPDQSELWPILLIDRNDDVARVIYTDPAETVDTGLYMLTAPSPYTTWTKSEFYPKQTSNIGRVVYHPKYDINLWENDRILFVPIEYWDTTTSALPIRSITQSYAPASEDRPIRILLPLTIRGYRLTAHA